MSCQQPLASAESTFVFSQFLTYCTNQSPARFSNARVYSYKCTSLVLIPKPSSYNQFDGCYQKSLSSRTGQQLISGTGKPRTKPRNKELVLSDSPLERKSPRSGGRRRSEVKITRQRHCSAVSLECTYSGHHRSIYSSLTLKFCKQH